MIIFHSCLYLYQRVDEILVIETPLVSGLGHNLDTSRCSNQHGQQNQCATQRIRQENHLVFFKVPEIAGSPLVVFLRWNMSLRRTCKGRLLFEWCVICAWFFSPFPVERCHFLAKRWIFLAGTSSFSCGKLVRMRSITNQYGGLVNQNGEYRLEILDGIREWQMSTAKISGLQHHPWIRRSHNGHTSTAKRKLDQE